LLAALASLRERLRAHEQRGEQTQLFFYYSGHSRSHALTLGREEMSLSDLRREILNVPSSLTVVVLDACQSGAFSHVKGAEQSADFSFNAVARLNTSGIAVMASSSAAELSQESDVLHASFFTHNLLLALRGAGDNNHDGKVSLDEAYQFTYNHTLTGTAATSVGAQHATLETDLRGKGDVSLSYPAAASAQLFIPASFAGRILLQQRRSDIVLAELDKAGGEPVRMAFPPGNYTAYLRQGDELSECEVTLTDNRRVTLDTSRCQPSDLDVAAAKGNAVAGSHWAFELSAGVLASRQDSYTHVLRQFDFGEYGGNVWLGLSHQISLTATRMVRPHLALVLSLLELDAEDHHRLSPEADFNWSSYGLGVGVRTMHAFWRNRISPFAQVSVGPAAGFTHWQDPSGSADHTFWGYYVGALAGLAIMPWRWLGFHLQAGYYYAPIIENDFGNTHDSGGIAVQLGARVAY